MRIKVLAALLLAVSGASGQPPAAAAQRHLGIPYAQVVGVDPDLLSLDIHTPEGAKGLPVVVYVHGGGWQRGDRANVAPLAEALSREKYVFVSTNYRLAPDAAFPVWPEDVAAAIAWVHEHIEDYGGDPEQLCLMGHSAGAHLVALVATDETYLAKHGLALADISAVIPLDTQAYDIAALGDRLRGTLPAAYRVPFTDSPELWAAASPITHVEPGKQMPPMVICYSGGMSPRRPNAGRAEAAERFAEALRQAGTTAEVIPAPEKTHAQIARQFGADGDHVAEAVFAFLRRVLATGKARTQLERRSPEASPQWVTPAIRAPRLQYGTFRSAAAGSEVSYHIYTPEAYDAEPERCFPVLYWLHGAGGGLPGLRLLTAYFDGAVRTGEIPPMLIVFPNGLNLSLWVDSKGASVPMETVVVTELVPHIDATFRTIASREGRLVEGFSMGGYGAARLGLKHHDLFGAVSILSGGPLQRDFTYTPRVGRRGREWVWQTVFGGDGAYFAALSPWVLAEREADAVREQTTMRLVIGERDEMLAVNEAFHARLVELEIPHTFTVLPGVGHNTPRVLEALGEANWEFYRSVLGAPPPGDGEAQP